MVIMTDTKLTYFTDEKPSLEKAQELVGGLVEFIQLKNGDQMLINEEGLLQDLEINVEATRIAANQSDAWIMDGIRGNAIILKEDAKWD
tara:strand:- start:817 stop:1083 length:267 start_codon:yes stop_codon:yes gene_type:complete